MKNTPDCPVDFVSVNENKIRLIAFFVFVLAIVFLVTNLWLIMAFLVVDFFLRAYNFGKFSLLGKLSDAVVKQMKINNKPTDRAPKRFAAGVGLIFTIVILATSLLNLTTLTIIITAVLIFFAFLESFAGFCAGCYVYSMLQKGNKLLKIK